ncbi:MAG TPA: ester cyclase [Flavisolibacter sp.]|jgi:hypothetical protein|nr:ester cyclase [Flavisolibacter sp.]
MEQHADLVSQFIRLGWNERNFDKWAELIHPAYTDRSLPASFPPTSSGTIAWIGATGASFEHHTAIEAMVAQADKVMIKVRMQLKHTGTWRGIAPTGKEISTTGYRYFRIRNKKILEHEALIDGTSIENQLKETAQGCRVPLTE